jgi:hypothetical protein
MRMPYTRDTGPPLNMDDWKVRAIPSQEACKVRPNETIGFKEMYLYKE